MESILALAKTGCPITKLLTVISAKWTVEILRELCIGPTRTRRFLACTPGLTMKSLRQRLIALEQLGMIHREQFDEKPLRVEYSLTPKGRRIADLLAQIKALAEEFDGEYCICPMDKCDANGALSLGGDGCPHRRQRRLSL